MKTIKPLCRDNAHNKLILTLECSLRPKLSTYAANAHNQVRQSQSERNQSKTNHSRNIKQVL